MRTQYRGEPVTTLDAVICRDDVPAVWHGAFCVWDVRRREGQDKDSEVRCKPLAGRMSTHPCSNADTTRRSCGLRLRMMLGRASWTRKTGTMASGQSSCTTSVPSSWASTTTMTMSLFGNVSARIAPSLSPSSLNDTQMAYLCYRISAAKSSHRTEGRRSGGSG